MIWLAYLLALRASDPPSVRVGFAGDVSLAGRKDDPSRVFARAVQALSAPDLTVANLEGLLLGDGAPP